MEEINKATRRKLATLVEEGAPDQEELASDYRPEASPFAHLRRAEIWVPSEVWAHRVPVGRSAYFGVHFEVGVIPPQDVQVSFAEVRVELEPPIERLEAWLPNDEFASIRQLDRESTVEAAVSTEQLAQLAARLPGVADLLPQLSARYRSTAREHRAPVESVIRVVSDGQRRLDFKLFRDPASSIDPRQFQGQILFAVGGEPADPCAGLTFDLRVAARCGRLRLKNAVEQHVEITVRD